MAKGLHSWTVQESGAPVAEAEIQAADDTTTVSFSRATRALMGAVVTASGYSGTMTLNLSGGGTLILPSKAVIDAVFAPGGIVPFACDSFVFSTSEDTFRVIGLF